MLKFLANNIEQLDLALEHCEKGDANNARFALMLVDNVVEITLHQIANDKRNDKRQDRELWKFRDKPYEHTKILKAALGRHFGPKVKFARLNGLLDAEEAKTITTCHAIRNEVYHIGIQHERILPALATFHFKLACEFLSRYTPLWLGGSSNMIFPERAKKYFGDDFFFAQGTDRYQSACSLIGNRLSMNTHTLAAALADHIDEVIEDQDLAVDMIATGGPRQTSRDDAVAKTMAWIVAFSEDGREFARINGWSEGNIFDFVRWIEKHYPLTTRTDPVPAWQVRAQAIRRERNPHKALEMYRTFMRNTVDTRHALSEAHAQVEQYIQEQIDQMRGK